MKALAKTLCAAVAFFAAVSFAQAQQDNVLLRYKLKKDAPLVYEQDTSNKQTQTVKNLKIETDSSQKILTHWTLTEVDAKGNLHIQSENKGIVVDIKSGPVAAGVLHYDSKNKANKKNTLPGPDLVPLFERLGTAKLTLVIT